MSVVDLEICDCDCHNNDSMIITHIMACCDECPICGQRIRTFHMREHLEGHKTGEQT